MSIVSRSLSATIALLLAPAAMPVFAAPTAAALTPASVDTTTATTGAPAMLRAQVLLERAHFSPGEIDAGGGGNTTRAIEGFQRARKLDVTGKLDAATWAALGTDAAPALATVTLTAADVAGPFAALPRDMMEKSKVTALGYESIAEALGERYHSSPTLLKKLNPGKAFAEGEQIVVPDVASATPLPKAAKVIVDRSDSIVLLVDAQGAVIAQFPASTGSSHDPLPVGEWKIQGVAKDPTYHYNPTLFWDADPKHAKAKLPAGPNNPVGSVWVDLSKPHYGIHGTPEPAKIGKTESHGCIRMTNWSALQVAGAVAPGTPALLRE